MKKSFLCAIAFAIPATALAQDKKPSANVTGFLALDVFKWVKKEGSREEMNVGIGTINVDARARNGGTSLKIKLDLDGALANRNAIFEEATITQEVTDSLAFTAGKGVVPFHQKHYGVIKDSYVDGGTIIGNYFWNYGDQDRRYLVGSSFKFANIKNYVTFFAEGAYQPTTSGSWVPSSETKNKQNQYEDNKGIDPRDQRGIADKLELKINNELSVAVAGLYTYHRLDPHANYAAVTSARYVVPQRLEVWCEFQYGHSSSFRYSFKKKNEVIGQVGAEYFLGSSSPFSILVNAESANFIYTSTKTDLETDGTLSKMEAGIGTSFSDKASWVNGYMYEVGRVSDAGVERTTARTGQQFTSTFTFSF